MIIDDHSRMIVGGGIFFNDNAMNFLAVLKRAVIAYGIPDVLYMDYTDVLTITKFLESPPSSGCFSKNIGIVF